MLAVDEVATNSVLHGGGRGIVRLWREDETLVCEVRDQGIIRDPLAGRMRPDVDAFGGRGLWIANAVCELVQIRPGAVRVRSARQRPAGVNGTRSTCAQPSARLVQALGDRAGALHVAPHEHGRAGAGDRRAERAEPLRRLDELPRARVEVRAARLVERGRRGRGRRARGRRGRGRARAARRGRC